MAVKGMGRAAKDGRVDAVMRVFATGCGKGGCCSPWDSSMVIASPMCRTLENVVPGNGKISYGLQGFFAGPGRLVATG